MYDSEMELVELHEKLKFQKQQPKLFKKLYGKFKINRGNLL